MFTSTVAEIFFVSLLWFVLFGVIIFVGLNIYSFISENNAKMRKQKEYTNRAISCQKYIYETFHIKRELDTWMYDVKNTLSEYCFNRKFLLPKDEPNIEKWVESLEVICSIYKEVFEKHFIERCELLIKYKGDVEDDVLISKINNIVRKKCEDSGIRVY